MHEHGTRRRSGVTGVILAGGRGRRMHGRDKGLLNFRGRPLVEHVLAAIAPQTDERMIIANRHHEDYRRFGVPVYGDVVPGYGGPLVGMLTGLSHTLTPWALFVPCDAPRVPESLAQKLLGAAVRSGAAWAASGEDDHYACCLISTSLRADLRAVLGAGSSSIREGLAACGATRVDFGECPDCVWNLNTPEALQAAETSPT